MRALLIRRNRLAASALIVALAVAFAASCLPVEGATAEQQACCAAMDHACGPMAEGADCCATETAQVSDFTVAARLSVPAPALLTVLPALVPEPLDASATLLAFGYHHTTESSPPGVPRYLLTATLLI